VQLTATIANTFWSASNLPAWWRFHRALREPQATQARKLQAYITSNAQTAFGKAHHFDRIRTYAEFSRLVPVADYDAFEPWITRIRQGETRVLTHEPVTHLVPTSGSTGGRKLIPFTSALQREFNAAIGPWLLDLQRQFPPILSGPAYWSVTPALHNAEPEPSAVPIGFDSDTAYLGGTRRRLAAAVMAVPPEVQRATALEEFRCQTLLHLLRCPDLRLISVWHPSFLTLLLEALPGQWEELRNEIAGAQAHSTASSRRRANRLRDADPHDPAALWPNLRVISCWGDGHAEIAVADLQRRFPQAFIQPKGLLATEAVVTIPFLGEQLLAVQSHFFEFRDREGRVYLAHELREREEYEIIVTTGGGLWRYQLHDRVRVTGFVQKTPCLQFLGRTGGVSDRFGEKLSETFVAQVIQELTARLPSLPRFALLAPDEDESGCRYTLYLESEVPPDLAAQLDALLRKNPHYSWCRNLGQLQPPLVFKIAVHGYESFLARECSNDKRIGDVKPCALSTHTRWSQWFEGDYCLNSAGFAVSGVSSAYS
jgi:hypothetical protein